MCDTGPLLGQRVENLLLAQVERSQAGHRLEATQLLMPPAPHQEDSQAQDLSH